MTAWPLVSLPDRTGRQWQEVPFGGLPTRESDLLRSYDLSLVIMMKKMMATTRASILSKQISEKFILQYSNEFYLIVTEWTAPLAKIPLQVLGSRSSGSGCWRGKF